MTVLLLHGLGGARDLALSMFAPVVPAGSRVLALDVRAHGDDRRVGSADELTLRALAVDLAERVRRLQGLDGIVHRSASGSPLVDPTVATLDDDAAAGQPAASRPDEPITVVGISMGAAIALRLALDELLPLSRAVFVRPAFTDQPLPDNLAPFPVIGELLAELGPIDGEREFVRTELYGAARADSPRGAEGLLEQFRGAFAAERSRRLIEIPRSPAFTDAESLSSIRVPTAIAWAPRDPVHPVSVAELWMDELDGAASLPLPARDDDLAAYVAATRGGVAAWLGWR